VDDSFWRVSSAPEARKRLVEAMRFELLGPGAPDEILEESPLSRYLVGMLAPFDTAVPPEEQEDMPADEVEEDATDASDSRTPISQALSPSSIGLSCLLAPGTEHLKVSVEWGRYERVEEQPDESADSAEQEATGADSQSSGDGDSGERRKRRRQRWRRIQVENRSIQVEVKPDRGLQRQRVHDDEDMWVEHMARRLQDGKVTLSVFLVNRHTHLSERRAPADKWIFQPQLTLEATDGASVFLPRELEPELARTDRDLISNTLLFRERREFAIGHGCAVIWKPADDQHAIQVATDLVPSFELPKVEPRAIPDASFDMSVFAEGSSAEDLGRRLDPLADAYAAWIEERRGEIAGLDESLTSVADEHLTQCEETLSRIRDGIDLLRTDPNARRAFSFANQAMLLQRSHTEWAERRRREGDAAPQDPEMRGAWRPFQLAFILLNLRGIADPLHDDRRIGDLLWFPTGGGKTEAYLGLAAFTFAIRRLREGDTKRTDAGVSVLMRYTLRLLTIQQFQRATTLLCACEKIRWRDPERWGRRPFSIGLWLGRQATPNSHDESRQALDRLERGEPQDEANPCQLESCPWCGESISPGDYEIDGERRRTVVSCPRQGCDFGRESGRDLPVVLVDEEIYRECPSLLIATVDKFAQMPWNGEVATIFGNVDRECRRCGFLAPASCHPATHRVNGKRAPAAGMVHESERLAPPDLIIQDELHLITGPLGTMVGLYETAVDALSTRMIDGRAVSPKVIASTATIRRAVEQVQSLFARELRVFPSLALSASDSFFAVEVPVTEEVPGRLYLGVMAPGKSMKTALVRVCAALLSSGAGIKSQDERLADAYLTLIAYFNSLRELGGAVRLMEDDIRARLRQLGNRGMPARNRPVFAELTSRVQSDQIPPLLRRLQTPHYVQQEDGAPLPLDAMLASNMISVGVDVDRLGLMTVLGQPKTTAEYIQATSRVGRQATAPGLVVTIYNWVRPRDLSHYERFGHYHATLYRHVEAVSVTPFSSRALDRGLAGAFVSLNRLGDSRINPEDTAGEFDPDDILVEETVRSFVDRVGGIGGDAQLADEVRTALATRVEEWASLARSPLRYGWRPYGDSPPPCDVLLRSAEGGSSGHWKTPGSLREVEQLSRIYVRGLREDDR